MKKVTFWFLFLSLIVGSSQAQVTSQKSGAWEDPGVWSNGQVPDANTDVVITSGDEVYHPTTAGGPQMECQNLTIQIGAKLWVGGRNFQINGVSLIAGTFIDTVNAGNNQFVGQMQLEDGGILDTRAVTNPARVAFGNGIRIDGDSLLINRCSFVVNDQSLTGSKPIIFTGSNLIEAGITLTNEDHLIYAGGGFQGDSLTSRFANEGVFEIQTQINMSGNVNLNFAAPGNVVYFNRGGVQNIYPLEYDNLIVAGSPGFNRLRRNLLGPVQVNHDLLVDSIAEINFSNHALNVAGRMVSYSAISIRDQAGSLRCKNLEIHSVVIDGTPEDWGTIEVTDTLRIWGAGNRLDEVNLTTQYIHLTENATLTLGSDIGDWNLGSLQMDPGSILDDLLILGRLVRFSGPVQIAGTFTCKRADFQFEDRFVLEETGLFDAQQAGSQYDFQNGMEIHGEARFIGGSYLIQGEVSGSQRITFLRDVLIPANASLINLAEAGLEFRENLQGTDNTSGLENHGYLILSSVRNTISPMDTGITDFCSQPGNVVEYAAVVNNQRVIPGCYQAINFVLGSKLLNGDVNVRGNLHNEAELRENIDLFNPGPVRIVGDQDQIITGNGIYRTLEVAKNGGSLASSDTFLVGKSLIMTQGILQAQNGGIGLITNSTLSETDSSYVLGRIGAERNLATGASNFGGLGLRIQTDPDEPLGSTVVVRVTGSSYRPGQITRYYEVNPANNSNLNATVEFSYHEREINGAIEANLDLINAPNGETFEILGGRNLTVSNIVRKTQIDQFGILTLQPSTLAVNAYPSPFTDETITISYVLDQDEEVLVTVFDNQGRALLREEFEGQAGLNQWELDRNFTGGIYYVSVVSSDKEGFAKFVNLNPPE